MHVLRTLVFCLVLPACLDEEPPDVPTDEVIFTIEAPASFDALVMILADGRETVTVDPPRSIYVWDYRTYFLPDALQMVAYRDGAVVASANGTFTYSYDRTPNGMYTIELL